MITYLNGDATEPQGNGNKIIVHICNDIGAWGAGFVLAISNKWKGPEQEYRNLNESELQLGNVQLVKVGQNIYVANMIAQHKIKSIDNMHPIRYEALRKCLKNVREKAILINASIHMPRIGTGLAGGDWKTIEGIIEDELYDINTYVYDLK